MKLLYTLFAVALFLTVSTQTGMAQAEIGQSLGAANSKSEDDAVGQAVINTVTPIGVGYGTVQLFKNNTVRSIGASLVVYGLIMGPSTGNFYANDYLRGGLGALTRVGAAFLLKDATSEIFGPTFANALNVDNAEVSFGDTEVLVGSVLMIGTIAYNIFSAPASVREYNQQRGYALELRSLPGTGHTVPMLTTKISL